MNMKYKAEEALVNLLECPGSSLSGKLEYSDIREKVDNFLRQHKLYIMYKPICHIRGKQEIQYHGLSYIGVDRLLAFDGGRLGTTVEQHFYSKYGISMWCKNLQCVITHTGEGKLKYYPLELIW